MMRVGTLFKLRYVQLFRGLRRRGGLGRGASLDLVACAHGVLLLFEFGLEWDQVSGVGNTRFSKLDPPVRPVI
jgi:hypothetical protein